MAYISSYASGTGQPTSGSSPGSALTVGTEYTLDASTDVNVGGEFKLVLDLDAMAANDVLEVRVYKAALTGGTVQLHALYTFYGVDGGISDGSKLWSGEWEANDLTDNNAVKFTLKQTFGTARSIVWKILRKDVLAPTTAGRTLDVSATGEAGVDWANVGSPTTTVGLTGTTVGTVTTLTDLTSTANAEPASPPASNASLASKIAWMFLLAKNKILQTATTQTARNNADGADVGTATVSDDGTTFTRGKWS